MEFSESHQQELHARIAVDNQTESDTGDDDEQQESDHFDAELPPPSHLSGGGLMRVSMFRQRLLSVCKHSRRRISLMDPPGMKNTAGTGKKGLLGLGQKKYASNPLSTFESGSGKQEATTAPSTAAAYVKDCKRFSTESRNSQGSFTANKRASKDETDAGQMNNSASSKDLQSDEPAEISRGSLFLKQEQAVENSRSSIQKKPSILTTPSEGILGGARAANQRGSTSMPATSQKKKACPFTLALRNVAVFSNCSDKFIGLLASSGEHLHMKVGDSREMDGSRVLVARVRPAMAIIVASGTFKIQIARNIVEECAVGACFGLANVFASVGVGTGRGDATSSQAPVDFVVRAWKSSPDGCKILAIHSTALKSCLLDCPQDHAKLHEILQMMSRQSINSTQHFVARLNCSEAAKSVITSSATRHLFVKDENICREGRKGPEGLVLIRSGTVSVEINGIPVRQLSKGQVMGEEILFAVCNKWSLTARCTTFCDVQILQRRLFVHWIKELQSGNTEEKREAERLLLYLEGRWKDEKVVLAWPLFRGYDQELLEKLAQVVETRILLQGNKLWETGSHQQPGAEVALYVLLCGSCEEITERPGKFDKEKEVGIVKRAVAPGTCIGTREFLALQSNSQPSVVKACAICIVAVLHRDVFLHVVDTHPADVPQAAEITRVLKDDLDRGPQQAVSTAVDSQVPPMGSEAFVGTLPMFNGHDKRFVERICEFGCKRRFCINGQAICDPGVRASSMFVFIRGQACLSIADLHLKHFAPGESLNVLALAKDEFIPTYKVTCERTCELWALASVDFAACLETFSQEKSKWHDLLHAPSVLKIMTISDSSIFRRCSEPFLAWIQAHLHPTVFFTNEIIVREGEEDSNLYIVRSGSVITEGEGSPQVRMESGSSIGEHRLLDITTHSQTTVQAIEMAVVQVLHRRVWQKGLESFPDQVPLFDTIILSQMEGAANFALRRTPFFQDCDHDFCSQIEKLTTTELVHPGTIILDEGSEDKVIRIIKSGSVIVAEEEDNDKKKNPFERTLNRFGDTSSLSTLSFSLYKPQEPTRHAEGSTLNMDVALGATRCATSTYKAESLCAIGHIEGAAFLGVLQRFPKEIVPLLRAAAGGALWPKDPESVPLFRGVNSHFFKEIIEKSDWRMFMPKHCVVKQGCKGDVLYLLCYGVAAAEIDGIAVGSVLVRGDCIGKLNFLGLATRYASTVRARIVCHFQTTAGSVLTKLLQEQMAERERFEALKVQARAEAAETNRMAKRQTTQAKVRQREESAFRNHIVRERECHGFDPLGSNSSLVSLFGTKEEEQEEVESLGKPSEVGSAGKRGEDAKRETRRPTYRRRTHRATEGGRKKMRRQKSDYINRFGAGGTGTPNDDFDEWSRSDADSDDSDERGNAQNMFFEKMQQMSTASLSKLDKIDAAISEHAETRQRAILKGRVLRMFYSDIHASLSREDLHELDFYLPKLPTENDEASKAGITGSEQAERRAGVPHGRQHDWASRVFAGKPPMRNMPKTAEHRLRQKSRHLANMSFGAVMPTCV